MGVFDRTDHLKDAGHEQVVFCQDRASGLKAIIAIYSTALGGTRFYPYADEAAAVRDVLALSKAMAYKAACANVDLGGGKAVIIGDPSTDKTEALLRAYGRFVQSLGGRYYTACDVGTYVQDMDVIAKESQFVTGRSPEHGGGLVGVRVEAGAAEGGAERGRVDGDDRLQAAGAVLAEHDLLVPGVLEVIGAVEDGHGARFRLWCCDALVRLGLGARWVYLRPAA